MIFSFRGGLRRLGKDSIARSASNDLRQSKIALQDGHDFCAGRALGGEVHEFAELAQHPLQITAALEVLIVESLAQHNRCEGLALERFAFVSAAGLFPGDGQLQQLVQRGVDVDGLDRVLVVLALEGRLRVRDDQRNPAKTCGRRVKETVKGKGTSSQA